MGVSFFLDQTKTSTGFVSADLAKSVASVKKVTRRMGLVTTTVEEKQIGDETTEFYLQKERWSSETRVEQEALPSTAWWTEKCSRRFDQEHFYPLLAPLAVMIYTIPTSSASSERSWSIHDFIYTKRRNRLDARRVEQLVFIYCNAGSKDDKANIFYQAFDEGESDDGEDDEGSLVDIDYNSDDDSSVGSGFSNSNAYSYDGSEEQKFEYEFEC
ncbi:hypothetical protein PI124_g11788 [Phytophthora idaei]|nr:hypothetical protein PI125_g11307 [Phytophthora idaei]KAG3152462.1 hypothetical protein PI126_g10506 [Phytophthora idaei]KAG3243394.1 hypothetical protein PI124_g11788 [Phytophthora idaei]